METDGDTVRSNDLGGDGECHADFCSPRPIDKPDVVATKAHRSPELENWINIINAGEAIAVGSSLKFCSIAEGDADLYPRMGPTMEWDTAAGQAILEAAGGQMLAPDGNRFSYGKPGRLNGYFSATAKLDGAVPAHWLPPQT